MSRVDLTREHELKMTLQAAAQGRQEGDEQGDEPLPTTKNGRKTLFLDLDHFRLTNCLCITPQHHPHCNRPLLAPARFDISNSPTKVIILGFIYTN